MNGIMETGIKGMVMGSERNTKWKGTPRVVLAPTLSLLFVAVRSHLPRARAARARALHMESKNGDDNAD